MLMGHKPWKHKESFVSPQETWGVQMSKSGIILGIIWSPLLYLKILPKH